MHYFKKMTIGGNDGLQGTRWSTASPAGGKQVTGQILPISGATAITGD